MNDLNLDLESRLAAAENTTLNVPLPERSEAALAVAREAGAQGNTALQVRALLAAARLSAIAGDYETSHQLARKSALLVKRSDSESLVYESLRSEAVLAFWAADFERSISLAVHALQSPAGLMNNTFDYKDPWFTLMYSYPRLGLFDLATAAYAQALAAARCFDGPSGVWCLLRGGVDLHLERYMWVHPVNAGRLHRGCAAAVVPGGLAAAWADALEQFEMLKVEARRPMAELFHAADVQLHLEGLDLVMAATQGSDLALKQQTARFHKFLDAGMVQYSTFLLRCLMFNLLAHGQHRQAVSLADEFLESETVKGRVFNNEDLLYLRAHGLEQMGKVEAAGHAYRRYAEQVVQRLRKAAMVVERPRQLAESAPPPLRLMGDVQPAPLVRAKAYIDQHLQAPVYVEDVALAARVSARRLAELFALHEQCSVAAFVRKARLDRIRTELLAVPLDKGTDGTVVRDIARRWGLPDANRMGKAYELAFGETPSQTLGNRGL